MRKFFLIIVLVSCFAILGIAVFSTQSASAKNIYKQNAPIVNKNLKTDSDILALIDNYQEQYFTIIKRNDVLLNSEDNKILNKDRKELKNLSKKVKKQINNKTYLNEYKRIEKKYSKCEEITTTGINDFAEKNYKEVDDFLNSVYKEVQSKLPSEDFNALISSEQKWLKEVNNYEKVYNSMNFGTIGTIIYYDYQIDMKSFRALLLMLYL